MKILILLCLTCSLFARSQSKDSLLIAQQLVNNKKFHEAVKLLDAYRLTNSDPFALQLQAQLYYWLKENERAFSLYKEGRRSFPDFLPLHLDYARVLFETGQLKEAESEYRSYLVSDPANAEARINLIYLFLWKGNISHARSQVEELDKLYPDSKAVHNLKKYINDNYAAHIQLNYDRLSDDQPLQANQYSMQARLPLSALFSPHVKTDYNRFIVGNPNSTLWIRGGNSFRLGFSNTVILLEGGYFVNNKDLQEYTAVLKLDQRLSSSFRMTVSSSRLPYQYTMASIERPFLYNLHAAALEFNRNNSSGRAGMEVQQFEDNNAVTTIYGWGLFPLVRKPAFSFHAGYGISFANSTNSRLRSEKPLNDIINTQPLNSQVQGVYDPYFTPLNQVVNSLLLSSQVVVANSISVSVKGSFGLLASADNPVLILERRNNTYSLTRSFYRQQYNPMEIDARLDIDMGKGFSFLTKYNYSNLFFYSRHIGGLSILYRFSYENKP
jgi:hypothetical protein